MLTLKASFDTGSTLISMKLMVESFEVKSRRVSSSLPTRFYRSALHVQWVCPRVPVFVDYQAICFSPVIG